MPDDLEALRKRIEEGVEAAEEMQRILQQQERGARGEQKKRFRLIKGGLVGAGIWSGVEWLRNGRRIATALVAAGVGIGGAAVVEHPDLPGADPPPATARPPDATPTKTPTATPTTALTPRRTSPPRTQVPMRVTPPPATPPSTRTPTQTKETTQVPPTRPPTRPPATPTPTTIPSTAKPIVSTPVLPTVTTPSTPVVTQVVTPDGCTINLLGIRVCLPLG